MDVVTDLPEKQAGAVRWFSFFDVGGDRHLGEPRRSLGREVKWEALCGLQGVIEDGQCQTCLEVLVDACAER